MSSPRNPEFVTLGVKAWSLDPQCVDQVARMQTGHIRSIVSDLCGHISQQFRRIPLTNDKLKVSQLEQRVKTLESELLVERTSNLRLDQKLVVDQRLVQQRQLSKTKVNTLYREEHARLVKWLTESDDESKFKTVRLENIQALLRRRITRLERSNPNLFITPVS